MYIKSINIKNFRLFNNTDDFIIDDLKSPDGTTEGSGLNVFVGDNGCGKTSLLDALTLPLLEYKSDNVTVDDFYTKDDPIKIQITSEATFEYDGTMPRTKYKGKGFEFEGRLRSRDVRSYLSTIVVSDQRFIRADGETKPEDGKPDLRLKVDNPWTGVRYSDNDILYLDRNRTFQIRSGTYNPTRFDRLMEDYNHRHLKANETIADINAELIAKIYGFENSFLKSALDKFEEIFKQKVSLNLINNYVPFKHAFFGVVRENMHQISISEIGSGYEMIFTLLYSYFLSQQSGKQLILLIDEPELHLHPSIQEEFAKLLLEFSKTAQVIITTHSPLLVKQIMYNDDVLIKILKNESKKVLQSKPDDSKLSYVSSNEVNFIAFQLPTEEYHNELFEELKNKFGSALGIKDFDINFFQTTKSETASYPWKGTANQVTLHTFVRNQIHHRSSCGTASIADLKKSIETMRSYL